MKLVSGLLEENKDKPQRTGSPVPVGTGPESVTGRFPGWLFHPRSFLFMEHCTRAEGAVRGLVVDHSQVLRRMSDTLWPSAADSCRPGEGSGAWPRPGPEPHAGLTRFSSRACCQTRSEAKSELAVFFLHTPAAPVCFSFKLPLAKRTAVDRVGRVTTRAGSDVCCCHRKLKSAVSQNLPSRWEEKPLATVRSCPCLQAAASLGLSAQTATG